LADQQRHTTAEWAGKFGAAYTDRNDHTVETLDEAYQKYYGLSRTEMNSQFLSDVPRTARILEVGCNLGVQLECLQRMGFENLYAVELQWYAIERARERLKRVNIIQGSALDIPFKDGFFDLVYTSGLLVNIAPEDLEQTMREIHRCSSRLVWGYEYFDTEYREIPWHGREGLLWKANFALIYQNTLPDLRIVKEQRYPYLDSSNVDSMYLLEKD